MLSRQKVAAGETPPLKRERVARLEKMKEGPAA